MRFISPEDFEAPQVLYVKRDRFVARPPEDPLVERIVAASRGETAAEMKVAQAREAPGPDPEEIVDRGR